MNSFPPTFQIGDHIRDVLSVVHPLVASYTYPLFAVDNRGRPELFASSVLLEMSGRSVLLTAAHAIYEIGQTGSAVHLGATTISPVPSTFVSTSPAGTDPLDLAATLLPENFRAEQSMTALGEQSYSHGASLRPHMRCVHGYPITKNKTAKRANEQRMVFSKYGLTYAGASNDVDVEFVQHAKDRSIHLAMRYQRESKNELGEQVIPPHPKGISGGGMWSVPNSFDPGVVLLEGIAIEFRDKEFVFATRIEHAVPFIQSALLR